MEQEINTNANAPFLLIQKPQELIRLFESLIDRKIREILLEIYRYKKYLLIVIILSWTPKR